MNVDWISGQLDYIYFAYGLFLTTQFLICVFLNTAEKDRRKKPAWLVFGLFGLTSSLYVWFEMVSFLGFAGGWPPIIGPLLIVPAFLFLLEFGRRETPRLAGARATWALYGSLLLLALSGVPYGLRGAEVSVRYFLGLPAGFIVAWAFFQEGRKRPPNERPALLPLSVAVAAFTLSVAAIVPKTGFALAPVLNNEAFLQLTGVPVQFLKALLALAIALLLGWHSALSARPGRRSFFGVALALALLTTLAFGWYRTEFLGHRAARDLEAHARSDAENLAVHIGDSLKISQMMAKDLAEYPTLTAALVSRSPGDLDQVNTILDQHQRNMGLAVLYLLDSEGLTIASSNRTARDSFVGTSYAFRPYFKEAIAGRPGDYFALGITSGERGYYASYPVADKNGRILGVVVAKKGLDALEGFFREDEHFFFVSPEGVIFLSGSKENLFRSLWPATAEQRAALLASRQFGTVSFAPLLEVEPPGASYLKRDGRVQLVTRVPSIVPGWSVVLLSETTGIAVSRLQGIGITFVVCVVIFVAFTILLSSENALQNSLKLLELRRRNEAVLNEQLFLQQFISEVSRALQSAAAMTAVLQQETEIAVMYLDAAFARIWTVDTATNLLELQASGGMYTRLDGAHARIPVGRGKIGQIAREGKPLHTNAVVGDPGIFDQEWARREGMQAFAGYPLKVEGRVIGVLGLFARQTLNESVLETLGLAADLIASYIDRKRAEDALNESEKKYRTLVDSANEVLVVLQDGMVRMVNAAAMTLTGYSEQEFLSQPFPTFIWPDDRAAAIERYQMRFRGEVVPNKHELRLMTKDGKPMWYLNSVVVIEWHGRPATLNFLTNIEDRKQAEKALQEKSKQLEDLTHSLEGTVEVEIAVRTRNEQLLVQQSKMAAMGEMLGAIAHQWRQPLNTLGMCVQNIGDVCAQDDLDRAYIEKTVRKSMDQIQHMSATIDDFRNFFLPDKERSRFDAMAVVGDVLTLLSAQLAANSIGFRLTCHTHARSFQQLGEFEVCPEKTVDGFRNEFGHVVLNLIINARDAIATRREAAPDEAPGRGLITFDFFNRDGAVIIEVGDNGTGIPEAIMPRIFEPYFTAKDPSKGTGIGLYMSKIIVEEHMKGRLDARNGPEGAVFSITLRQAERTVAS